MKKKCICIINDYSVTLVYNCPVHQSMSRLNAVQDPKTSQTIKSEEINNNLTTSEEMPQTIDTLLHMYCSYPDEAKQALKQKILSLKGLEEENDYEAGFSFRNKFRKQLIAEVEEVFK